MAAVNERTVACMLRARRSFSVDKNLRGFVRLRHKKTPIFDIPHSHTLSMQVLSPISTRMRFSHVSERTVLGVCVDSLNCVHEGRLVLSTKTRTSTWNACWQAKRVISRGKDKKKKQKQLQCNTCKVDHPPEVVRNIHPAALKTRSSRFSYANHLGYLLWCALVNVTCKA